MSHTWEDYQVKLLDKDRAELGSLVNVHNLKGSQTEFGDYGSLLTFSININDTKASHFVEQQRHFIQVLRGGTKIFDGFTVKTARRYATTTQGLAEFIEVTCMPLSQIVSWRHGQPVTAPTLISSGRTADDGFKWLLERTHGATAPNSPTNATNRTLTGFTLEADSSERAGNVTIDATGKNMYDLLLRMGARYEVDWWVEFDASWNMEFKTKYPRRGLDRTEGNGARTEVIFNDSADTVRSVNYGYDAGGAVDAVMNKPMTVDAENATMQANWLYMETVIDTEDAEELEAELARRAVAEFYKSDFVERADLVWDPSDSVTGPHFDIGDKITYVNKRLGYGPHDAVICKITFEILANGEEKLTLTFGDPIPDIFDKQKNKRRSQAADNYTFLSYWRRDGTNQILYPTYSVSGAPDHVATTWGGDIRAYSDERSTLKFDVDGLTGNTAWADAAQMTWESMAYRMPVDAPATGEALMVTTGTPNQLQWALPKPDAHDILSAYHGDTLAAGVSRGSVIYGNSTPKWAELTIGGALTYLGSDGTDAAWTSPSSNPGAAAAILASDAAGDLTVQHITAAAGYVYVTDVNTYIRAGGVTAYFQTDKANIALSPGSADEVYVSQGGMSPETTNVTTLGAAAKRWSNVVSVLGNFTGDVTIGTGVGIIHADSVAAGKVLIANGTRYVPADLSSISGHDILAATHTDTLAAGVSRGSLIYGNATPKWAELTIGAASTHLESDGTDVAWQANITMADGATIGQAAGPLVTFDDTNNFLELTGASLTVPVDLTVRWGAQAGAATGLIKYAGALDRLGIFTWGDAKAIQIGGSSVIIAKESGAASGLTLWTGGDLLVYSDAGTTLKASIDGATGNVSVGWGSANAQLFFVDANTYISAAVVFQLTTDLPLITLAPGGGGSEVECGVGYLEPTGNNVTTAGRAASRWSNVYSVLGNFSGNVDIGAGCDVTGNITVTGTVDSIDVYNHTHAVVGNTANYNPGGNASLIIESADPGTTQKYFYTADDGSGTNPVWRLMYAHAQFDHLHAVSIESGIAGD